MLLRRLLAATVLADGKTCNLPDSLGGDSIGGIQLEAACLRVM